MNDVRLLKNLIFAGPVFGIILTMAPVFAKRLDISPHPIVATAEIAGKSGSSLTGQALLIQTGNHMTIKIKVEKAPPGLHGVHLHEKGDCSDPAAKSAGDHLNPTNDRHGNPAEHSHHAGDFGNIAVKEDGTGFLELNTDQLILANLGNPANSALDRAIVIHEKVDDFTTQPTGNSGARIGCGVIQKINLPIKEPARKPTKLIK